MEATDYPATLAGYFDDLARAESALAAVEALDLGPLRPGFEKANLWVRQIEDEETAEKFFQRVHDLFDAHHEGEWSGADRAIVMVRGLPERLEAEAAPLLMQHGASEVKRYGGWNVPSQPDEQGQVQR